MDVTIFFNTFLQPENTDSKWLNKGAIKQVVENICTLIHDQPMDSIDLVDCLANITRFLMNIQDENNQDEASILLTFFLKKSRGYFKHELKNEPQEWLRRKLYYNSVLKVLKNLDTSSLLQSNEKSFVTFVRKNVPKDRKQSQLEDVASEVQLICEKISNDQ